MLITYTEIYNIANIDLADKLSVKGAANETTYCNSWLLDRENEVIDFIATANYYGRDGAKILAYCTNQLETMQRAIIAQVEYVLENGRIDLIGDILISNSGVNEIDRNKKTASIISTKVERIIKNSDLYYGGRL